MIKRNKKNFLSSLKEVFIIFVIGFLIIFAGYGFQLGTMKSVMTKHYIDRAYEEFNKQIGNQNLRNFVLHAFEKIKLPFPSYFFDIGYLAYQSKAGLGSFLDGRILSITPWYYPIAVFFYKTQLSLIILLVLSFIFFSRVKSKNTFDECIQILPIIIVFVLFMINNMTAGLRHILPVYPFIFLFCSKILRHKKAWINILVIILTAHYVTSSLLVFPYYMAYFNEFAGGPANGYRHLVGYNLDGGQDLPGLKKFMEKNNIDKVKLSYFGSIDPKEYVNYDYLPAPYFQHWVPDFVENAVVTERNEDCSEKKGWVAISVTNLQNMRMVNKTCFNWLKKYEPVAKIGYSIFVYNLSTKSE